MSRIRLEISHSPRRRRPVCPEQPLYRLDVVAVNIIILIIAISVVYNRNLYRDVYSIVRVVCSQSRIVVRYVYMNVYSSLVVWLSTPDCATLAELSFTGLPALRKHN